MLNLSLGLSKRMPLRQQLLVPIFKDDAFINKDTYLGRALSTRCLFSQWQREVSVGVPGKKEVDSKALSEGDNSQKNVSSRV